MPAHFQKFIWGGWGGHNIAPSPSPLPSQRNWGSAFPLPQLLPLPQACWHFLPRPQALKQQVWLQESTATSSSITHRWAAEVREPPCKEAWLRHHFSCPPMDSRGRWASSWGGFIPLPPLPPTNGQKRWVSLLARSLLDGQQKRQSWGGGMDWLAMKGYGQFMVGCCTATPPMAMALMLCLMYNVTPPPTQPSLSWL